MTHNFPIRWVTFFPMLLFHVGAAIGGRFLFSWKHLVLAVFMYWLSLCPGIGVGFHRLLTHKGYETYRVVQWILTFCGYLALQGSAVIWVMLHKAHHQFVEVVGRDPHTPREGKWWAHMGWMIWQDPQFRDPLRIQKFIDDTKPDGFQMFLHKYPWVPSAAIGLPIWYFFGFGTLCWAVFVPVVAGWHSTWLVNSATHLWGSRAFETGDDSRNSWWVALLTFGEGWHNNHHHSQQNPRHGLRWYQIDVNWYFIWLLGVCGLASNIKKTRTA